MVNNNLQIVYFVEHVIAGLELWAWEIWVHQITLVDHDQFPNTDDQLKSMRMEVYRRDK